MHHVTTHGAPKITMDSKERDYQERLRQTKAQSDGNPAVMGVQVPVNPKPEAQVSSANNTPIENVRNETGNADMGTSMTENATKNPDQFQTEELDRRLNMYAAAASNAGYSLNDQADAAQLAWQRRGA